MLLCRKNIRKELLVLWRLFSCFLNLRARRSRGLISGIKFKCIMSSIVISMKNCWWRFFSILGGLADLFIFFYCFSIILVLPSYSIHYHSIIIYYWLSWPAFCIDLPNTNPTSTDIPFTTPTLTLTSTPANYSIYFFSLSPPLTPPEAHCIKVSKCFVIYVGLMNPCLISSGLKDKFIISIFWILIPI